jgi:hypothetical protein
MTLAAVLPRGAAAADIAWGNFKGSGHTCYGMLTITSRLITWMTPYSFCRNSPYMIRNRREGPDGISVTYLLKRQSAKCRFRVVVLSHGPERDAGIGWDVIGYLSLGSAERGVLDENVITCSLYRY